MSHSPFPDLSETIKQEWGQGNSSKYFASSPDFIILLDLIKTLLRRETRGVIFSWWRWAVFALCWTPWGWEHNIPRLISCDASWKQPRDGVNIRVRRPLLPSHDPRDRNELNKAILSARVTPQWILMNFFTILHLTSIVLCLRIFKNLLQEWAWNTSVKSHYFTWWQLQSFE